MRRNEASEGDECSDVDTKVALEHVLEILLPPGTRREFRWQHNINSHKMVFYW